MRGSCTLRAAPAAILTSHHTTPYHTMPCLAPLSSAGAPRSLAGLMDLMRSLARSLAAQAAAGGAAQGRDSARRLVGALQRLGDNVQARALATAYGLEMS